MPKPSATKKLRIIRNSYYSIRRDDVIIWSWLTEGFDRWKGPPGLIHLTWEISKVYYWIEWLLFRTNDGKLAGALEYIPRECRPEEDEERIQIAVHPHHWGEGIGTMLLEEVVRRWNLDLSKPNYTVAGRKMYESYKKSIR